MDEILRTLRPGEAVAFSHQDVGIRVTADRIVGGRRYSYSLTLGHDKCELFRGGEFFALNTARVLDRLREIERQARDAEALAEHLGR